MAKNFKFRTSFIKEKWPVLIAIIASLLITYFAYSKIQPIIYQQEAFVDVIVASKEIRPYTVLTQSDIGTKRIIKTMANKQSVQDPSEIVGKITTSTITAGGFIMPEQLNDAKKYKDLQLISVPTDISKSVGGLLKPGDVVDAYWVDNATAGMWKMAASDLTVMDVLDSSGNAVRIVANDIGVESKNAAPNIIVVAGDSNKIFCLIGGAIPDVNIVFVKKIITDNSEELAADNTDNVTEEAPVENIVVSKPVVNKPIVSSPTVNVPTANSPEVIEWQVTD